MFREGWWWWWWRWWWEKDRDWDDSSEEGREIEWGSEGWRD